MRYKIIAGSLFATLFGGLISCGQDGGSDETGQTLTSTGTGEEELTFIPDPGIRMDYATNASPAIAADGTFWLYYTTWTGANPSPHRATSADGITFSGEEVYFDRENDPRRALLPDGTYRFLHYDANVDGLGSTSSSDGLYFSPDQGIRYFLEPEDNGTFGVFDCYTNSNGEVVLLYIGAMGALNNVRRAVSTDGGWNFTFDGGNVCGDDEDGGLGFSHVDPRTIELPDGSRRLFTMKQGPEPPHPGVRKVSEIYSFYSADGKNFTQEEGLRLIPEDFTEFDVWSLHDPWVVRLSDGRYRMYITAILTGTDGITRDAIVSATTP